eukprot:CAMPEP_0113948150 /NCGR_PEP_ID=MMETSP1339-20121228/68791_1 /TAXON_ID=94617 /ORGANISM="Fibrocapsa japonica" /LENGTH=92 /DNA_ID=CAMNT_0000955081 /DNA_START=132 /DNA_END=410 /DNA_ORIENTATION=- /assembly_acc=CAM_ASM_000762
MNFQSRLFNLHSYIPRCVIDFKLHPELHHHKKMFNDDDCQKAQDIMGCSSFHQGGHDVNDGIQFIGGPKIQDAAVSEDGKVAHNLQDTLPGA